MVVKLRRYSPSTGGLLMKDPEFIIQENEGCTNEKSKLEGLGLIPNGGLNWIS